VLLSRNALRFDALQLKLLKKVSHWGPTPTFASREERTMAKNTDITIIKKYANRRLYNTGTSTYVTLEDLSEMVKRGEEFEVQDAKTSEDLTHAVLTQIIFELENKNGETMLPIPFLRQLIAFYGDQMQTVVPSYLEHTMAAFTKEQERMREQMSGLFAHGPIDMFKSGGAVKVMEAQVRRNMEMFQNAMRLMTPFGAPTLAAAEPTEAEAAKKAAPLERSEIDQLREQISAMQRKLDTMG
jgi:polyhydroxyalkanoate synthesis repressor PhaR